MVTIKLKTEDQTMYRKPHRKGLKKSNLNFPVLAQPDSKQPSPAATLLGWPKSIYYFVSLKIF